jgi:hypothetical protein
MFSMGAAVLRPTHQLFCSLVPIRDGKGSIWVIVAQVDGERGLRVELELGL